MGVLDAWIGDLFGAYGDKPTVPYYLPPNTRASQATAIDNNLFNFGPASQLADRTNAFNQDQAQKAFDEFTGGQGAGLFSQGNELIGDYMSGVVPDDVSAEINRNSAARALSGGYGGSALQGNATARDLGLTSLDLQKFGLNQLPGFLGAQQALRGAPRIGPESMFVSPQTQIGLDDKYNDQLFNRNWLFSQIEAMPDPTSVAYAQGISSDIGGLTSAAGGMAGMGGGGGGM